MLLNVLLFGVGIDIVVATPVEEATTSAAKV